MYQINKHVSLTHYGINLETRVLRFLRTKHMQNFWERDKIENFGHNLFEC